ncbi:class I SAM-dependent methyltransferase [Chitiniphilus purpureus]|uniref:Ribosomal RNA small subunit methyltransferase J n=1 Tax=Chitiniphilus purpureus TaxID=2981137 RepID=A0ABY6DT23_9NEIS|nr:class I SAM-dependent methyltransferase [Chitiniphilus sp. CD1]UXY16883.1 class I SAM-dependent methyltransferase [Chitiniphilus sp. CD1]
MTGLIARNEDDAALATRYGLPLLHAAPPTGHYLMWIEDRLNLCQVGDKARVAVDFVGGAQAHRRRFGGGLGQPVARAVGLKPGHAPSVLDATAGLARDAFVLATLGCEVTLLERSPVACALVDDGLARAARAEQTAGIAARMRLIQADALQWLCDTQAQWAVLYLDPMFPEPDKRAKSKKEMAAFQALIGGDADADGLLEPARLLATRRVVVKRPRHAPWLAGQEPAYCYEGDSTRFDVYLPRS